MINYNRVSLVSLSCFIVLTWQNLPLSFWTCMDADRKMNRVNIPSHRNLMLPTKYMLFLWSIHSPTLLHVNFCPQISSSSFPNYTCSNDLIYWENRSNQKRAFWKFPPRHLPTPVLRSQGHGLPPPKDVLWAVLSLSKASSSFAILVPVPLLDHSH